MTPDHAAYLTRNSADRGERRWFEDGSGLHPAARQYQVIRRLLEVEEIEPSLYEVEEFELYEKA